MIAYVLADRPLRTACADRSAAGGDAVGPRQRGVHARHRPSGDARGAGVRGRDFAHAALLLRPVRSGAHRFGGSHAQRDLIDLTLLAAADRAGDRSLAAALAAERMALRPNSPDARRVVARWPMTA
jgi:hypothetical protein